MIKIFGAISVLLFALVGIQAALSVMRFDEDEDEEDIREEDL